jgi:hypothetical protein
MNMKSKKSITKIINFYMNLGFYFTKIQKTLKALVSNGFII